MRIAVPVEDGKINQHFGHTQWFNLYEVTGTTVQREMTVPSLGEGHDALAAALGEYKVNVLLCGGIGGKARVALEEAGIIVYGGIIGTPQGAVDAFLSGGLRYDPSACAEGGGCGSCSEDCASHSCHHHNS